MHLETIHEELLTVLRKLDPKKRNEVLDFARSLAAETPVQETKCSIPGKRKEPSADDDTLVTE